jgi:two-component system, NtrC family, sensor histidine kinase PilS
VDDPPQAVQTGSEREAKTFAGLNPVLEQRLKTLMGIRLVMVTTLLLTAVYVESVSEYLLPFNPFYLLIATTYALTIGHAIALRSMRSEAGLVFLQVIGDLLMITGLVYLTGGGRAGFILLYPISVLTGSVLLFRGGGLALAAIATLLYAGLLGAVRAGLVPPEGLSDILFLERKAVLYSVFVTGVACATVAFIGSYLSESLHTAGERLQEAAGQMADLQKLNEMIVNSIHSGLMTVDEERRVLFVNEFGERILGRDVSSLRGQRLEAVFGPALGPERVPRARTADSRVEIAHTAPDGSERELGLAISPLVAGEGGYLLVFQDLTEIKRLERQVRVREKLAAVGEMAAQLAHEIRNPLGSISGSAQVLLSDAEISSQQAQLLDIIRKESKRLSDSLSQFLLQTRAPAALDIPVDLRELIDEAVTLLRNSPEVRPEHSVEFEADAGPHRCLADRDKIAQVFWNLARNGLEAMPDGGRLVVRLASRGDEVVLSVRDEGRGLAREEQRRIFEPFRSGTSMGTGLGLAIVYRIIREHRGDIIVRSVPARGTEFEIHLPLAAEQTPA